MKKRDKFTLPSATLQKAFKSIKGGRSREWVAQMIMNSIVRAVERNPSLKSKSAYAQIPEMEALKILEERLRICDPACAEHADYAKELQYFRGRRRVERHKERIRTDEEFRQEFNSEKNAWRKEKYDSDPEFRQQCRDYANAWNAKKRKDPAFRIEQRRKRKERYENEKQNPEFKERTRERNRKYREKRKARMKVDPEFAQEQRAKRREENRRWEAKVKLREQGISFED